jgi:tetratricopeptide (TPR) repeat protein
LRGPLACVLILAAGLAVYWNSFDGPFIFDDPQSILENSTIKHLWPIGPVLTPPGGGITVQGRPLLNLSLAINWAIGQDNVQGYHIVNLAIHLSAGLLLFGVIRRTLRQPRLNARLGQHATGIALVAALVWVVHPLQTESVTYIVQRTESIVGLFYLLTLYSLIRGAGPAAAAAVAPQRSGVRQTSSPAPAGPPRSLPWFSLAIVACLCGMASKEVMVTAPVVVLLYDRTFLAGSFKGALRQRWPLYVALAATWGLLAYLVATSADRGGSAGFGLAVTAWQYASTQLGVVAHYLGLAFWPDRLVLDYGWPLASTVGEILPGAILVGLLLAATLWAIIRRPSAGFLGACFFLLLSPSSSLVPVASEVAAEHRMYLPLAAVVVLAVTLLYQGWQWLVKRIAPQASAGAVWALPLATAAIVVAILGYGTLERNNDYRAELSIWQDTVTKRPGNPRASYLLGLTLARAGRVPEAIQRLERAVQVNPDYPKAQYNLGWILAGAGRMPEAIERYQRALQLNPDLAEAHSGLGVALARVGKMQEAIGHYERALQLNPDSALTQSNLGVALASVGREPEAIPHYERALQLKPDYPEAENNFGSALARMGKMQDAIPHFERALQLKPDYAKAEYNLAVALASAGKDLQAIEHYERALQLQPDYAQARDNLAKIRGKAASATQPVDSHPALH